MPITSHSENAFQDLDNGDGKAGKTTRKSPANGSEEETVSGGDSTSKVAEDEEEERETEEKEH